MDKNGYNPSLFPTDCCYICGRSGETIRHEVFHGSRRAKSKKYGCWVTLCVRCHTDLHNHPASYKWLQEEAQLLAQEHFGWTVEDFRKEFDKSYL